ncbi:MAG: sulfite exporter TauE/SafE family protein [Gemmatimonadota bacterium]
MRTHEYITRMISLPGLIGFVAVGIALGLLGGGGSILAVPVLVHLMDLPARVAVPMSLPVVGIASAAGAFARWRRGQLRLDMVVLFSVCAMGSSYLAARIGTDIPDRPRLILFAVVMLVASALMWRRSSRQPAAADAPVPVVDAAPLKVIPVALAVGVLTGLVGVGGGFLIVPALAGVLGLPMAAATATSLAVIALNTAAAGAGWIGRVSLDWTLTAVVTGAALVGMAIGTQLAPRFSARTLTRAFAVLLLLLAAFMLFQEFRTPGPVH